MKFADTLLEPTLPPDDVERVLEAEYVLHRVLSTMKLDDNSFVAYEFGELELKRPNGQVARGYLAAQRRLGVWRFLIAHEIPLCGELYVAEEDALPVLAVGNREWRGLAAEKIDDVLHEVLADACDRRSRLDAI